MRYFLHLYIHNSLGDGFTELPVDAHVAERLIDAGCESWPLREPYTDKHTHTVVAVYARRTTLV